MNDDELLNIGSSIVDSIPYTLPALSIKSPLNKNAANIQQSKLFRWLQSAALTLESSNASPDLLPRLHGFGELLQLLTSKSEIVRTRPVYTALSRAWIAWLSLMDSSTLIVVASWFLERLAAARKGSSKEDLKAMQKSEIKVYIHCLVSILTFFSKQLTNMTPNACTILLSLANGPNNDLGFVVLKSLEILCRFCFFDSALGNDVLQSMVRPVLTANILLDRPVELACSIVVTYARSNPKVLDKEFCRMARKHVVMKAPLNTLESLSTFLMHMMFSDLGNEHKRLCEFRSFFYKPAYSLVLPFVLQRLIDSLENSLERHSFCTSLLNALIAEEEPDLNARLKSLKLRSRPKRDVLASVLKVIVAQLSWQSLFGFLLESPAKKIRADDFSLILQIASTHCTAESPVEIPHLLSLCDADLLAAMRLYHNSCCKNQIRVLNGIGSIFAQIKASVQLLHAKDPQVKQSTIKYLNCILSVCLSTVCKSQATRLYILFDILDQMEHWCLEILKAPVLGFDPDDCWLLLSSQVDLLSERALGLLFDLVSGMPATNSSSKNVIIGFLYSVVASDISKRLKRSLLESIFSWIRENLKMYWDDPALIFQLLTVAGWTISNSKLFKPIVEDSVKLAMRFVCDGFMTRDFDSIIFVISCKGVDAKWLFSFIGKNFASLSSNSQKAQVASLNLYKSQISLDASTRLLYEIFSCIKLKDSADIKYMIETCQDIIMPAIVQVEDWKSQSRAASILGLFAGLSDDLNFKRELLSKVLEQSLSELEFFKKRGYIKSFAEVWVKRIDHREISEKMMVGILASLCVDSRSPVVPTAAVEGLDTLAGSSLLEKPLDLVHIAWSLTDSENAEASFMRAVIKLVGTLLDVLGPQATVGDESLILEALVEYFAHSSDDPRCPDLITKWVVVASKFDDWTSLLSLLHQIKDAKPSVFNCIKWIVEKDTRAMPFLLEKCLPLMVKSIASDAVLDQKVEDSLQLFFEKSIDIENGFETWIKFMQPDQEMGFTVSRLLLNLFSEWLLSSRSHKERHFNGFVDQVLKVCLNALSQESHSLHFDCLTSFRAIIKFMLNQRESDSDLIDSFESQVITVFAISCSHSDPIVSSYGLRILLEFWPTMVLQELRIGGNSRLTRLISKSFEFDLEHKSLASEICEWNLGYGWSHMGRHISMNEFKINSVTLKLMCVIGEQLAGGCQYTDAYQICNRHIVPDWELAAQVAKGYIAKTDRDDSMIIFAIAFFLSEKSQRSTDGLCRLIPKLQEYKEYSSDIESFCFDVINNVGKPSFESIIDIARHWNLSILLIVHVIRVCLTMHFYDENIFIKLVEYFSAGQASKQLVQAALVIYGISGERDTASMRVSTSLKTLIVSREDLRGCILESLYTSQCHLLFLQLATVVLLRDPTAPNLSTKFIIVASGMLSHPAQVQKKVLECIAAICTRSQNADLVIKVAGSFSRVLFLHLNDDPNCMDILCAVRRPLEGSYLLNEYKKIIQRLDTRKFQSLKHQYEADL